MMLATASAGALPKPKPIPKVAICAAALESLRLTRQDPTQTRKAVGFLNRFRTGPLAQSNLSEKEKQATADYILEIEREIFRPNAQAQDEDQLPKSLLWAQAFRGSENIARFYQTLRASSEFNAQISREAMAERNAAHFMSFGASTVGVGMIIANNLPESLSITANLVQIGLFAAFAGLDRYIRVAKGHVWSFDQLVKAGQETLKKNDPSQWNLVTLSALALDWELHFSTREKNPIFPANDGALNRSIGMIYSRYITSVLDTHYDSREYRRYAKIDLDLLATTDPLTREPVLVVIARVKPYHSPRSERGLNSESDEATASRLKLPHPQ